MDVVRLDSVTYYPDTLIEGYNSMVWTERFRENGDFEMKTPKVAETRTLLPEGKMLGLLDSKEVMIVETHSIGRDSEGYPELTITGRTVETFLENRVLGHIYHDTPWQVYRLYTPSEFVSLILWNHVVNTTGEDPSRAWITNFPYTAIPQVVTTDSTSRIDTTKTWWLEPGVVYDQLRDILALTELGVRAIRPPGTTGNVMTFDTSRTVSRGTVSKVLTSNIPELRLDVYNGINRTRWQSTVEPVIFHYEAGDIEDPEYLFSIKDYKNLAMVIGSMGTAEIWPDVTPAPDTTVAGFARRTLYVDVGKVDDTMTAPDYLAAITQKGRLELKKHNLTTVFDCAISPLSPYKYGEHYFLGDYVTLLAEYGFESSMIVSEYVRTEDQAGDRGYPGLSTIV